MGIVSRAAEQTAFGTQQQAGVRSGEGCSAISATALQSQQGPVRRQTQTGLMSTHDTLAPPDSKPDPAVKWTITELQQFAANDDLHVAPFRDDGKTSGTPTWVWSVVVDAQLYARAYNGQNSRWYQAALRQKAGRITVGGSAKEAVFEPCDGTLTDRIDDGYRAKYHGSSYLAAMIGARARSATVRISPR